MQKTVMVVCGLPGSGKTWVRDHSPSLFDMPAFDIADVYWEHEERFPDFPIDWQMALAKLLRKVRAALQECDTVVIEGVFRPGSPSRERLEWDAKVGGYRLQFRPVEADPKVCWDRIMALYKRGEIPWASANVRLTILKSIVEKEEKWKLKAAANAATS